MKINIRKAEENDFEGLLSLFREFATFQKSAHKMINSLEKMKKEKDFFHCFIAEFNEEIIGYATCFFSYHTWTGKCLYMDDLFVKEACRGRGTGTKLLETVISYAQNNECHKLKWQVSNWNQTAIKFYKWMGAEIDDVEYNCDLILKK